MQGEELRQTLKDTINELLFYFNDFHDKLHLLKSKIEQVKESVDGYRGEAPKKIKAEIHGLEFLTGIEEDIPEESEGEGG